MHIITFVKIIIFIHFHKTNGISATKASFLPSFVLYLPLIKIITFLFSIFQFFTRSYQHTKKCKKTQVFDNFVTPPVYNTHFHKKTLFFAFFSNFNDFQKGAQQAKKRDFSKILTCTGVQKSHKSSIFAKKLVQFVKNSICLGVRFFLEKKPPPTISSF